MQSGPIELTTNNSIDGNVWVDGDTLLFEISEGRGEAVTVNVDLSDDQDADSLGSASISWPGGNAGTQYIEFTEFGVRPDGAAVESCNYTATLTNDDKASEGTAVWMNIYRG